MALMRPLVALLLLRALAFAQCVSGYPLGVGTTYQLAGTAKSPVTALNFNNGFSGSLAALTGVLTLNWGAASGFPLLAPDGLGTAPSYSFTNSTGTGMYSPAANQLGFSANGALALSINASQDLVGATGAGGLTFGSMTGNTALPTGNLSWAGASNKTISLVSTGVSGAITITAGGTSTWSTSGGNLTVDTTGTLNVGPSATTAVLGKATGVSRISGSPLSRFSDAGGAASDAIIPSMHNSVVPQSIEYGRVALSGGTATVNIAFLAAPVCTCTEQTAANGVFCTATSSQISITGTGTDTISYVCIGNR